MLAAKVRMRPGIDLASAIASINALEKRLKEQVPELRWSFVEADDTD
jgi:hypothetical protein